MYVAIIEVAFQGPLWCYTTDLATTRRTDKPTLALIMHNHTVLYSRD